MSCQDNEKKTKLGSCMIKGQKRAFIDENLQMRVPGSESATAESSELYTPVYTHYMGSLPPLIEKDLKELDDLFTEAQRSYDAWNRMKKKLLEALEKDNK